MGEKHMGSGIDDFLREEGIFEEAQANAIGEVAEWRRLSEQDSLLVLDLLENPPAPKAMLRAAIAAMPKRRD
jgi:uncharacterized protein (DUF1778 family)